jgi:PAS domain S-box-containing protein
VTRFRRSAASFIIGSFALAALTLVCLKLQLSAPVLYLTVVVFVALDGSFAAASAVSIVAALLLQNYFDAALFSLHGADSRNALRLAIWLMTAFVITRLVARARRRERDVRNIIDALPALVLVVSPTSSDYFCNQRFLDYFGRPLDESLRGDWQEALHPVERQSYLDEMNKAMLDGQLFEREARLRNARGEYRWFLIRLVPMRDVSGKITHWCATSVDIHDLKSAEENLRQAQEDLERVTRVTTMGELVASIAHEVNQPLAAVVTNANAALRWLAADPPNLEEVRLATARIAADGNRASDVVKRVRALLTKKDVQREPLSIDEVIGDVVALTRGAALREGTSVHLELSADPAVVLADRVQVEQLLLNLILNGMEAMQDVNGRRRDLTIQSGSDNDTVVRVAVRDSGAGIPDEHLPHIFDAFYTTKNGGLGMGLAIGRSVIEAHGGRIWVTSEPTGSTFQFTLPAAKRDAP